MSIRSSTAAGSNVTVVVDRSLGLILPVGLCVDTDRRRLYWFDAEYHAVVTSRYDGTDVVAYRFGVGVVNLHVYKVCALNAFVTTVFDPLVPEGVPDFSDLWPMGFRSYR